MDNPKPELPASICAIFRYWASAATALAGRMPASSDTKRRLEQATETIYLMGMTAEKNATVLLKPAVTYGKIEFMTRFMAVVERTAPVINLPSGITKASLATEIKEVQEWLVHNR